MRETEYEKYRVIQDRLYESDFDRFLMLEQEVNRKDEILILRYSNIRRTLSMLLLRCFRDRDITTGSATFGMWARDRRISRCG